MAFYWNEEKNEKLKETRDICFERIVIAIESGDLITALEHPNKETYKNQFILVVNIDDYAFCVPCVEEKEGGFFLKTIFPSRKYTKLYIKEGS